MATSASAVRTSVAAASAPIIPVGSILNLRDSFPGKTLIFEIDLAVSDCWDGLERLAAVFRAAGLRLKLMRCNQTGLISCAVIDGGGDLSQLSAQLPADPGITVAGWTTRILYE